jgi:hypothetical protein
VELIKIKQLTRLVLEDLKKTEELDLTEIKQNKEIY